MLAKKIFLAHDDVEDRLIIQDVLELLNAGDRIEFANNGEELLKLLKDSGSASLSPCLIVLDLNMPKIGGTQTLSILKNDESFKHIPVIIYSTSINPVEKEKCILLGAHSFITKPMSFVESKETVQVFLRFCELPSPG